MKKLLLSIFLSLLCIPTLFAQNFRFAVISDMLISESNKEATEDLRNVVADINKADSIKFVLVLGNLTAQGDKASLELAKAELEKLDMKYYAVSGTNETKWGSSGSTAFTEVFGSERFNFEHAGIRFMGFASGPIVKTMDGHVDVDDIFWFNQTLSKNTNQPSIIATHYPLTMGEVDNWYEATDMLRQFNVKAILSGRLRRNTKTTYDGIPALSNVSTLRDKYHQISAYNIYTVADGKLSVAERKIDEHLHPIVWAEYFINAQAYTKDGRKYKKPDYSINYEFPKIKIEWSRNIYQPTYSSPAVSNNKMFFGDDNGVFYAFSAQKGEELWKYKSGGRIIGTPDANSKVVVFGSVDKTVYGLDVNTGAELWQHTANDVVLGSVNIDGNVAYVGASDGSMYALDVNTGGTIWQSNEATGHIETKPLVLKDKIVYGAWDGYLYAINKSNGTLVWKWKGHTDGVRYSPAAAWPVAAKGRVFITSPDGYITALDAENGEVVWKANNLPAYESIGVSEDGQRVYMKTAKNQVVAYSTEAPNAEVLWATNIAKGDDNSTSMLVEKGGTLFGSSKNGTIFALHAKSGTLLWKHKLTNTFIGTVVPMNSNRCIYVTSQGTFGLLEGRR